MTDIARLFQAFLAPGIFVSATVLLILSTNLILSINLRLMGIATAAPRNTISAWTSIAATPAFS